MLGSILLILLSYYLCFLLYQWKTKDPTRKEKILTNEEIINSYFFQFMLHIIYPFFKIFYGITFQGLENLPKNQPCVIITYHTMHNLDNIISILACYAETKYLLRSMVHRTLIKNYPFIKYLGGVAGSKENFDLLIQHSMIAVIPGGADEAIRGGKHLYQLYWQSKSGKKRLGFAKLAKEYQIPIVPVGIQNSEEMVWSPIGLLWSNLQFGESYDQWFLQSSSKSWMFNVCYDIKLYMFFFFWECFLVFLCPVKVTYMIDTPIYPLKDEEVEKLQLRAGDKLATLLHQLGCEQGAHHYLRGIKERIEFIWKKSTKKE